MSTSGRFEKFLANVSTTSVDHADATRKVDVVAKKLHEKYYFFRGYNGSTRRIIGSYGKGTQVRPPRDVDVLFMMPEGVYRRFNQYEGNGQSALLQEMKAVLLRRYPSTDIRGDGQVVVVPFTDGHAVEVLPAWRRSDGKYTVPNTHDGGSWQVVDHDAEIANVNESDTRSKGNTRNLIKMMKVWQEHCNVPIKSLVLEFRAVNFLSSWEYYDKSAHYYDWMTRDFFSELIKKKNSSFVVPGTDEKCHYGSEWLSRAKSAYERAAKACEFESAKRERDATVEWRKIFGDRYEL